MNSKKRTVIFTALVPSLLFIIFVIFIVFYTEKVQKDNSWEFSSPDSEILYSTLNENAVNLNTVDFGTLSHVRGVGISLAHNIIDYREAVGGFSSVSELMNVNGIDKELYDSIKEYFYIGDYDLSSDDAPTLPVYAKININTATVRELMRLDGIGEQLARAIVEYRSEKGDFVSINEIKEVSGISEKLFKSISGFITV